ncbi:MAG: glyoxalase [Bacteroidota bacterium]
MKEGETNYRSIRAFIGAKDFQVSRHFYKSLGFTESIISEKMSYFYLEHLGFYLQDYYVKDWIDNTMMLLEVSNVESEMERVKALDLPATFNSVRLTEIQEDWWGSEFFIHDPSGVLWHIAQFKKG